MSRREQMLCDWPYQATEVSGWTCLAVLVVFLFMGGSGRRDPVAVEQTKRVACTETVKTLLTKRKSVQITFASATLGCVLAAA